MAHVVCSVFVLWPTHGWLARYGAIKLKKYLFTKAKEDYVLAEVASAKKGVHAKWKAIRDEYQTADTLEQVFNELVGVMVEEVASESHFDGLAGKERGEEEAGFVMAEPHVQYVVYRTVFGLWNKRKADLKQRVRLWLHGDAGGDERGIESDSSDENDPPGFSVVSLDEDEASVPSGAESAASGDEFDNLLEAESSEDEVEDDWVLRQAKEEWLARGFALEDFSQDMLNRVRASLLVQAHHVHISSLTAGAVAALVPQIKREEAEFVFSERSKQKRERRAMAQAERETWEFVREERRLYMLERWAMSAEDECVLLCLLFAVQWVTYACIRAGTCDAWCGWRRRGRLPSKTISPGWVRLLQTPRSWLEPWR